MKLYTEEQVRKAIELARDTHPEGRGYVQTEEYDYSDDEVIDLLTPIQLPSDEEIDQIALDFAKKYRATTYEISALIIGAKWMRDKIGGNK